ncbi:MAG: sigma-70 family RNA polymerase sigma factor [Vicinamibacterales bacterium]
MPSGSINTAPRGKFRTKPSAVRARADLSSSATGVRPHDPHPARRRQARRVRTAGDAARGGAYRTAYRLVGRPEDASDVVQETFLRAYRTFDNFRPGTNAKAWLFTVLYSIVSNRWRAERRSPEEVTVDDVESRFGAALASPDASSEERLLARLESSAEVDAALRALPDGQRAAVLLVDVEDVSYEDAAAVLGCPIGTVRSRLARGRRQLFVTLEEYARRTGALRDRRS